jgi:hypothetical protein
MNYSKIWKKFKKATKQEFSIIQQILFKHWELKRVSLDDVIVSNEKEGPANYHLRGGKKLSNLKLNSNKTITRLSAT